MPTQYSYKKVLIQNSLLMNKIKGGNPVKVKITIIKSNDTIVLTVYKLYISVTLLTKALLLKTFSISIKNAIDKTIYNSI